MRCCNLYRTRYLPRSPPRIYHVVSIALHVAFGELTNPCITDLQVCLLLEKLRIGSSCLHINQLVLFPSVSPFPPVSWSLIDCTSSPFTVYDLSMSIVKRKKKRLPISWHRQWSFNGTMVDLTNKMSMSGLAPIPFTNIEKRGRL